MRPIRCYGVWYEGDVLKGWVMDRLNRPRRFTEVEAHQYADRQNHDIGKRKYEARLLAG